MLSKISFPLPEKIECPKCKKNIPLYDPKGSEFCICPACYSYLQFVNDIPHKIKDLPPIDQKPLIPPGAEGIIKDNAFKIIAYLEKRESGEMYKWREYLLHNPEKGYATLSEYDGHWNLILGKNFFPKLESPLDSNTDIMFDNVSYKRFHKYTPIVTSGLGEFDWDVIRERVSTSEYIAPPYLMVQEKQAGKQKDRSYYLGEYLEPELIASAFKLDKATFPRRQGIFSNQPSKAYKNWQWILPVSLLMALAIFVTQFILISYIKPQKILLEDSFNIVYEPSKGAYEFKPFVTPAFVIEDPSSALEIEISSDISNNWLESTIVLVNEKTNETWEVTKGIEFYQGFEDGEEWTEGERRATALLSEIPKGKYHLNVYPASGDASRTHLFISVTANVTLWRNVLLALLLLCLLPAYAYYRMRKFEVNRWSNSKYSPFEK